MEQFGAREIRQLTLQQDHHCQENFKHVTLIKIRKINKHMMYVDGDPYNK